MLQRRMAPPISKREAPLRLFDSEKGIKRMTENLYDKIAPFYAALNKDVPYLKMAEHIKKVMGKHGITEGNTLLDLGCGSGNLTLPLYRLGFDMIGVDASEEMLSEARMQEGAEKILWLCQDATELDLYGTVKGAVSSLDTVNHITEKEELAAVFSLVHTFLEPNGVFTFDINSPYKFSTVYGENAYILENKNAFCAWQNSYDEKSGLCDFFVTVFEKNGKGYLRYDTYAAERAYALSEIESLLENAGFRLLSVTDGYSDKPIKTDSLRLVITAMAIKE